MTNEKATILNYTTFCRTFSWYSTWNTNSVCFPYNMKGFLMEQSANDYNVFKELELETGIDEYELENKEGVDMELQFENSCNDIG